MTFSRFPFGKFKLYALLADLRQPPSMIHHGKGHITVRLVNIWTTFDCGQQQTILIPSFNLFFLDRPYVDKNSSSNAVVKSWIGHEIILKCAVDANPAASFTWFQDGRMISRNANSTHNISTLSIKPIKITAFGRYSCKTENIKGIAWHNITVEQLCKCFGRIVHDNALTISISPARV